MNTKISDAGVEVASYEYSLHYHAGANELLAMRCAIEAYLPHLHPQPAELAEQQAVYIGMPVGEKTVARAVASLDQSLTFAQDFRAEDVRVVLAALAATGKQQAGEVQGDGLAQFSEWWSSQPQDVGSLLPYELSRSAWQAALAARQPVAHPVAVLRFDRGTPGRENEMPHVISCQRLPDGEYPVYAAPPAHGIDLGQFRDSVVQARYYYLDHDKAAVENCDRLLALIDSQRDAAPGVGL